MAVKQEYWITAQDADISECRKETPYYQFHVTITSQQKRCLQTIFSKLHNPTLGMQDHNNAILDFMDFIANYGDQTSKQFMFQSIQAVKRDILAGEP